MGAAETWERNNEYPPEYDEVDGEGLCVHCDSNDGEMWEDDADWVCGDCHEDSEVSALRDRLDRDQARAEDGYRDA